MMKKEFLGGYKKMVLDNFKVLETMTRKERQGDLTYLYNYKLIRGFISMKAGSETLPIQGYGIEIERRDMKKGTVVNTEKDSIEYISPQRHKVQELLRMVYKNGVSPIHLVEVLGEYVDTYIEDFDMDVDNKTALN